MSNRNDFRNLWLNMPVPERKKLVAAVGTSYPYLQAISGGFKLPSLRFAAKLREHMPTLNLDGFERAALDAGKRMNP